ncbi:enoyl-CoA hydratase/isomerase family protein [Roseovarius salinarum]|uniref:enoyl-CoA hydratase/isomerase family protein n=1 Tax=Roseovarius salinarum TaxID=1981892 RepID=UPI000C3235EF|nr:enoyl-CoA hydratase/isomerase family protein [Roseovarius salinarum]
MTQQIVTSRIEDGTLHVTINRAEKRNPLSRAVLDELRRLFDAASTDDGLSCAVLRGAGDRTFASGGDLKELADVKGAAAACEMAENAKLALAAVRAFPVPVIAALNGDALGGGAELAMACDMRIAAPHARIGFIQGRLAISSAWGGGVDLMRLVGPSVALQLLTRSEVLDAPAARQVGLVNAVGDADMAFEAAVADFLGPMQRQSPHVMRAFKALAMPLRTEGRATLDMIETERFGMTWEHPDHDAAVAKILNRKAG